MIKSTTFASTIKVAQYLIETATGFTLFLLLIWAAFTHYGCAHREETAHERFCRSCWYSPVGRPRVKVWMCGPTFRGPLEDGGCESER